MSCGVDRGYRANCCAEKRRSAATVEPPAAAGGSAPSPTRRTMRRYNLKDKFKLGRKIVLVALRLPIEHFIVVSVTTTQCIVTCAIFIAYLNRT